MPVSLYGPPRRVRCPLCNEFTRIKMTLIKKTHELSVAEQLRRETQKGGSTFGVRRVCPKCWFQQTVEACTIEEVAASLVLLTRRGELKTEGWGRGYLKDFQSIIEELQKEKRTD